MCQSLVLSLENRSSEISRIYDELEVFLLTHEVSERVRHDVHLALEELITNIISYGHSDEKSHVIKIRLELDKSHLRIEIRDDGIPFDPLTRPEPDTTIPLEDKPVGGLGILMARKSMDDISYERRGAENILTLTKRL